MSRFIKAINAQFTGRHLSMNPSGMPPTTVYIGQTPASCVNNSLMEEYRIRVGWERVVRCRSSELDRTLENVTQELTREVYDEFILGLIRLERAIIANDMEGALMLCHEIHREVGLH